MKIKEKYLYHISDCCEFTSRFACGQIRDTFLPHVIREILMNDGNNNFDLDLYSKRSDLFNAVTSVMKTAIYPELSATNNSSYGVKKYEYADNLYDIYKKIRYDLKRENDKHLDADSIIWNVDTDFTKFGNLKNIILKKIDSEYWELNMSNEQKRIILGSINFTYNFGIGNINIFSLPIDIFKLIDTSSDKENRKLIYDNCGNIIKIVLYPENKSKVNNYFTDLIELTKTFS